MLFTPLNVCLLQMVRLEGIKCNAKVRLPERRHIEMSKRDGTRLPTTAQDLCNRPISESGRDPGEWSCGESTPDGDRRNEFAGDRKTDRSFEDYGRLESR
jgi:hypothetical protein